MTGDLQFPAILFSHSHSFDSYRYKSKTIIRSYCSEGMVTLTIRNYCSEEMVTLTIRNYCRERNYTVNKNLFQ